MQYELKAFVLPIVDKDVILNSTFQNEYIETAPIGNFSTGLNYFIYQSYENINNVFDKLGGRTVHNVMNKFELFLESKDNKNDLQEKIKSYFQINNDVTNEVFMHIIEILTIFDIVKEDNKVIVQSGDSPNSSNEELNIVKQAINAYSGQTTYAKKKIDLAFALPKFTNNGRYREAMAFNKIMSFLYESLIVLNDGANLVIRLNDMYNTSTIKMIQLCNALFDDVYIYKPYYSKPYVSENYLICKTFNKEDFDNITDKFGASVEEITQNTRNFVLDFMADIAIDDSMIIVMRYINMMLGGTQHMETNKVMAYINAKNYFGDEYHDALNEQLEALKFVENVFLNDDGRTRSFINDALEERKNTMINNMNQNHNLRNNFVATE